jgi:hypothetical protein
MFSIWELFLYKQIQTYYQFTTFNIKEKNQEQSHKFGGKNEHTFVLNFCWNLTTTNLLPPMKLQPTRQCKGRDNTNHKGVK